MIQSTKTESFLAHNDTSKKKSLRPDNSNRQVTNCPFSSLSPCIYQHTLSHPNINSFQVPIHKSYIDLSNLYNLLRAFENNLSSPLMASTDDSSTFSKVFSRFDTDGDGKISPAELVTAMQTIGQEITMKEAEAVVENYDADRDGLMSMEEFKKLMEETDEEKERELRVAFEMYEMEGQGCITAKSLKRMLSRLGSSRDVEECMVMIRQFDLDGDGVLSFEEFRAMMMG
ncbi:hypothetical protein LUZ60_013072 [Juncus effusus]|nr:hypothetical protein LUZ60_013072 [Juncus effusus]